MALSKNLKSRKRKIGIYVIMFLLLIGAGGMYYLSISKSLADVETTEVKKGEFVIDVVVPGELKAQNSIIVKVPQEITGSLLIGWIVPEGRSVAEGDPLVQFDTADLQNKLTNTQTTLQTRRQELEELISKQKADSVQWEMTITVADLNLQLKKLNYASAQFEAENKRKQMEIDQLQAVISYNKTLANIETQRKNAKRTYDQKIQQIEDTKTNIADITKQMNSSFLYAPTPGLVVYQKNTRNGSEEKVKAGDTPFRGQSLIELPDLSGMKVITAINEVDVSLVQPRQEVIITLDANKDLVYYGSVSTVASIGRRESATTSNRIKVFDTEIIVEKPDQFLKPAMTTTCQIITDRMKDVVFIPRQSLIEANGETFAYVKEGAGKYKKTIVVAGQKNKDYVVIKEGLTPGQLVALRDPYEKLQGIGTEVKEKTTAPTGAAPAGQTPLQPNIQRQGSSGVGTGSQATGRGRG